MLVNNLLCKPTGLIPFMNPKLILLLAISLLGQMTQAQTLQLQPLAAFGTNGNGSILPGQRPYLTDGATNNGARHELQRSMAYNPTTGHLLILSRTNLSTGDAYQSPSSMPQMARMSGRSTSARRVWDLTPVSIST